MLRVSGPDLVIAACASGVIGAFPTLNARDPDELEQWLARIVAELRNGPRPAAPWCPNLIIHRDPGALRADVECVIRHGVEMVITSVGSPAPVIRPLHDAGCLVFADVATIKHARKAIEAGVDGLILLTAGAGGQTGWLNGFAFVRAVRAFFDGPVVLAGGVSDGVSLLAARTLGCDLAYMGTGFIAARESMASDAYKRMLVDASADDIVLTRALNGIPASMLAPSLRAAGLDPATLDEAMTAEKARELFNQVKGGNKPQRWKDVWSAGHSVSGVSEIRPAATLVDRIEREYLSARQQFAAGGAVA